MYFGISPFSKLRYNGDMVCSFCDEASLMRGKGCLANALFRVWNSPRGELYLVNLESDLCTDYTTFQLHRVSSHVHCFGVFYQFWQVTICCFKIVLKCWQEYRLHHNCCCRWICNNNVMHNVSKHNLSSREPPPNFTNPFLISMLPPHPCPQICSFVASLIGAKP